jgi:hypothetical protein
MSPQTHGSFIRMESPIEFPPASSSKLGIIITKLTDTEDGFVSRSSAVMYCWRNLH